MFPVASQRWADRLSTNLSSARDGGRESYPLTPHTRLRFLRCIPSRLVTGRPSLVSAPVLEDHGTQCKTLTQKTAPADVTDVVSTPTCLSDHLRDIPFAMQLTGKLVFLVGWVPRIPSWTETEYRFATSHTAVASVRKSVSLYARAP